MNEFIIRKTYIKLMTVQIFGIVISAANAAVDNAIPGLFCSDNNSTKYPISLDIHHMLHSERLHDVYYNEYIVKHQDFFGKIHAELAKYGFIIRYLEDKKVSKI